MARHTVIATHLVSGADIYAYGKEGASGNSISVRVPLTTHAKKRLGIPLDHKAFAMLLVEKPKPPSKNAKAVDQIATQLLTPGDPIYDPKKG